MRLRVRVQLHVAVGDVEHVGLAELQRNNAVGPKRYGSTCQAVLFSALCFPAPPPPCPAILAPPRPGPAVPQQQKAILCYTMPRPLVDPGPGTYKTHQVHVLVAVHVAVVDGVVLRVSVMLKEPVQVPVSVREVVALGVMV